MDNNVSMNELRKFTEALKTIETTAEVEWVNFSIFVDILYPELIKDGPVDPTVFAPYNKGNPLRVIQVRDFAGVNTLFTLPAVYNTARLDTRAKIDPIKEYRNVARAMEINPGKVHTIIKNYIDKLVDIKHAPADLDIIYAITANYLTLRDSDQGKAIDYINELAKGNIKTANGDLAVEPVEAYSPFED